MEIKTSDFPKRGLYLLFPDGRRINLTRDKVESYARNFEANLHQLPPAIRGAVDFQACPVCPEKDRALFCHALPGTLAFFDEVKEFKSFDHVTAVYRGRGNNLVLAPNITMQEALQYVAAYSLLYYCEIGRQYWKYFRGVHPLLDPGDMISLVHLNMYWDTHGDKQKLDEVLLRFNHDITCTCICQVKRLALICKDDALKNAFVNVQGQIELLAVTQGAMLEGSFEDFLANS